MSVRSIMTQAPTSGLPSSSFTSPESDEVCAEAAKVNRNRPARAVKDLENFACKNNTSPPYQRPCKAIGYYNLDAISSAEVTHGPLSLGGRSPTCPVRRRRRLGRSGTCPTAAQAV